MLGRILGPEGRELTPSERRLVVFFGLAYFAQGITGGLISQPLVYYFKSIGMTVDVLAQSLAVVALPWLIKPLCGLLTDVVPLFGYHRKSYLLVTTAVAAVGYLSLTQLLSSDAIILTLSITTLAIAATDVVVDALMVEHGQRSGLLKLFQGQQLLWLNVARIGTGVLGGWLSHHLGPQAAMHAAAVIIAVAPVALGLATLITVHERRTAIDPTRLWNAAGGVRRTLMRKPLWAGAAFVAFWNLTPGFGMPLYYHLVDHLQFDQAFIGQLNALGAAGAACGAWGYARYLSEGVSLRRLLVISLLLGVCTTLGYLFITDPRSALAWYFVAGAVSMIPLLTIFSFAASVCPIECAGFAFALFMAIFSAAGQVSEFCGALLFEKVFHHQLAPLLWIHAAVTVSGFVWLPFLPLEPTDHEARRAFIPRPETVYGDAAQTK